MDYKKAFFSALEESYLGSKVKNQKDKSGFANLLEIKSQYFQSFKKELEEKIEECGGTDIYNKLYTFFESYLNQTGVPFFNDTPIYKNIYARVYNNSKDTALFYKTQDLYYVKSDTLYQSLEIQDKNEKYTFCFEVDENNAQNADNSKNKIKFYLIKIEDSKIYIQVTYDKTSIYQPIFKEGDKDFKEDFLKEIKENKIDLTGEDLKEIFRDYKKQNEIDFFIHKNALSFLQEQFDLWMFQHLYKDSQVHQWELSSIQHLQKLRNIAFEVIEKIAKFEDELKAIWLKPKFAKNTQYVFSLDLIYSHAKEPQNLIKVLIEDKSFTGQIQEWRKLELIDESFSSSELLKDEIFMEEKYRYLPIDTKHLSEKNRYALLSSFEDLESLLNGELIKSDNFQALTTLMPKYQGKIDLIYIDPPYNTGNDDFIYIDKLNHSTWISMMNNRLELAKNFLKDNGSIFISITDKEQARLKINCDEIFGQENFIVNGIYEKVKIRKNSAMYFSESHEHILTYARNKNLWNRNLLPRLDLSNYKNPDNDPRGLWIPIPIYANHFYDADYMIIKPDGTVLEKPKNQYWRLSEKNFKKYVAENRIWWGNGDGYPMIKKFLFEVQDGLVPRSIYYYDETGGNPAGDRALKENFGNDKVFENPKPEGLIKQISIIGTNENSIIFDFFAGSGTTIATAQKLERKWLGVEMGEHFYEVIIPRIKKVLGGFECGISKEVEYRGGGAFRYYELESYEEALRGCEYVLDNERMIDYRKSRKLIKSLNKGERICLDMQESSRKDYDIFQTIANIMGWDIKRLFLDEKNIPSCEFSSGEIINLQEIDLVKYPKLKNLIWWK